MTRDSKTMWTVVVLAVVAGAWNLWLLRAEPFLAHPIIDAAEYIAEARALLAGLPLHESLPIHGPVYPLLLVPLLALFTTSFLSAVYWTNIVLTAIAVRLVYPCAEKAFGPWGGMAAGALVGLSPMALQFQVQALPVSLQIALHAALVYLIVFDEKHTPRRAFFAGVLAALSYLTHPGSLLSMALVLTVFLLARERFVPRALFAALGAALVLAPFAFWSHQAGEGFLPVQGNAGMNVYIGNRAAGNGTADVRPGYAWQKLTSMPREAGAEGSRAETRFFLEKTGEEIARDPAAFTRRLLAKAGLYVADRRIDASHDPGRLMGRSFLLRNLLFDAPGLLALALTSLFVMKRRTRTWRIALAGAIGSFVFIVLTVYSVRYRAPALPFLALLAAAPVGLFPSWGISRRVRGGLLAGGILIVILASGSRLAIPNPVRIDYLEGRMRHTRGDFEGAIRSFEREEKRLPKDPDIANGMGAARLGQKQTLEGMRHFRRAITMAPDYADAWFNRALAIAETGDLVEARLSARKALSYQEDHAPSHYMLGILGERLGEESRQVEIHYRRAVTYDPTLREGWNALGVIYAKTGRLDEAEESFLRARQLDPNAEDTKQNLEKLRTLTQTQTP
ncbi:MAG: tetratricopeptide repeat protein [Gemmatimonadetes bacterium]|nr:tetratricopeptide repeat protein [Gemmatimonadota bacterium]